VSLYSLAVSWEATGPSVPLETQNWLLQKAWTDTNRCTLPVNHCATMNHWIILNLSGLDSRERWMHDDRVLRLHLIVILCIHINLTCSYPRLWREVHEAWSLDHSGSTSGEDLLGNGGLLKLLRLVLQSSVDNVRYWYLLLSESYSAMTDAWRTEISSTSHNLKWGW